MTNLNHLIIVIIVIQLKIFFIKLVLIIIINKFFHFNIKQKNTIEEINKNNENNNKDEEFMPFELSGIFIDKLNNIKNILLKEIKLKKWKYKIKKNGYLIYKDENQFDIDINKYNNNIYIIKTLKRQGKYKIYNNIIRNITSKLK